MDGAPLCTVRVGAALLLCLQASGLSAQTTDSQPAAPVAEAAPAPAAPAAAQPSAPAYNLLTTPQLTGDWGGVRTALKDVGISISPLLFSGYMQNYSGGLNTRNAHDFPGLAQYNFEADFAKMKLIPGGSFFIRAVQSWNDGIKKETGSLGNPYWVWGSSGDYEILVDKWWWRQRFLDDRVEIRLGKLLNIVDLFDQNAYAGNMYSSFSHQALAANGVLPVSKGIGAFIKVWPVDWLYLQAGAMDPDQRPTRTGFDTAFHGTCHFRGYWEFGFTPKWDGPSGKLPGNYRFGTWYDPQSKVYFRNLYGGARPEIRESGDTGFYMNFDQLVWKENADAKDKQGLGVFGRYGYAHGDVNRVEHFWSLGAQYEGLIPTRNKDVLGFGMAQSIMSKQYHSQVNRLADRETVYELYYAYELTPWCVITPDVQVVTDPGGNANARDAIIGGVRIKIAF